MAVCFAQPVLGVLWKVLPRLTAPMRSSSRHSQDPGWRRAARPARNLAAHAPDCTRRMGDFGLIGYSALSASTGSTFAARLAGK